MNKIAAERDWSAMEVCHLLLNLPLQHGTRVLRSVDCRPLHQQVQSDIIEETRVHAVRSAYSKYLARDDDWEMPAYFTFLTTVNFSREPWRTYPRTKDRILNYFPRYKANPQSDNYEEFYRVKPALHHPHRQVEELKTIEGVAFDTFAAAFTFCQEVHHSAHPDDYYANLPPAEDDNFEDNAPQEDEMTNDAWRELAQELPSHEVETEDVALLGNRPIDLGYDWQLHVGLGPDLLEGRRDYWKRRKVQSILPADNLMTEDEISLLNTEQRLVYNLFVEHLQATLNQNAI